MIVRTIKFEVSEFSVLRCYLRYSCSYSPAMRYGHPSSQVPWRFWKTVVQWCGVSAGRIWWCDGWSSTRRISCWTKRFCCCWWKPLAVRRAKKGSAWMGWLKGTSTQESAIFCYFFPFKRWRFPELFPVTQFNDDTLKLSFSWGIYIYIIIYIFWLASRF